MEELNEKVNELKIEEVVEPKIDLDEVQQLSEEKLQKVVEIDLNEITQLSEELKNCDSDALNKFIHENKDELARLKEEFINEYGNVSNDDPIKKQLIEDLRILSIEI